MKQMKQLTVSTKKDANDFIENVGMCRPIIQSNGHIDDNISMKDNQKCRSNFKAVQNQSIGSEVMAEEVLFLNICETFCMYLCNYNTKLGS